MRDGDAREQRLAEALRANLRRRKAQARGQDAATRGAAPIDRVRGDAPGIGIPTHPEAPPPAAPGLPGLATARRSDQTGYRVDGGYAVGEGAGAAHPADGTRDEMTIRAETFAARSWLFAPGDSATKIAKATASDADIVLIDLEDAVADSEKPRARMLAHDFIARQDAGRERIWVRVNPIDGPHTLADLAAVMPARPGGIMLPKVDGRPDVERLDHYLSAFEAVHGIAQGVTKVIVLVTETAGAMFTTGDYKDAPRVVALTWGAEDLAESIGASSNRDADGRYGFTYELARSLCLLGAAAAGVAAVETIHGDFRDPDGLRRRAEQVRRDGYRGMLAIHPAQVDVINRAFSPDADEIAEAQAVVDLFAANPGIAAIGYKGEMLDRPHLARAERLLGSVHRT